VRVDPPPRDELAAAADDALRMLDTWGWLLTLADDLVGVGRALAPPPPAGELPPRARHLPPVAGTPGRPSATGPPR
jgi:hypothetical protein